MKKGEFTRNQFLIVLLLLMLLVVLLFVINKIRGDIFSVIERFF